MRTTMERRNCASAAVPSRRAKRSRRSTQATAAADTHSCLRPAVEYTAVQGRLVVKAPVAIGQDMGKRWPRRLDRWQSQGGRVPFCTSFSLYTKIITK